MKVILRRTKAIGVVFFGRKLKLKSGGEGGELEVSRRTSSPATNWGDIRYQQGFV